MRMNASRGKQIIKRAAQAGRLAAYAAGDAVRFWRHASLSTYDRDRHQLASRIMYNVHALEKGLAHTRAWAPGRGRKALANLNDAMVQFLAQGHSEASYEFQQGLAILRHYVAKHSAQGADAPDLSAYVDASFLVDLTSPLPVAGVKSVRRPAGHENRAKGFHELAEGRVSVREFSGEPIDPESVSRALRSAEKTPSVCNRQGWRVYQTEDKALMREVLHHQRGFAYEQMPEVLFAVTVSNGSFISPVERHQAFVDGGLFSMSLLYGLEAEGLAAVPLNACLYIRARRAVMRLLGMDPSDEIVMFIAIGDHPSETIVPRSDRRANVEFVRLRGGAAAVADHGGEPHA